MVLMSPLDFLALAEKKIVTFPNEILTTPAGAISDLAHWEQVCETMLTVMRKNDGIGLAAPQVGLPFRLFITDATPKNLFYLNPEILSVGKETELGMEGCLSLPKEMFNVNRFRKVKVRWQTLTGKTCTQTYEGYPARVIQHELDHLDGKLINRFKTMR